MGMQANAYWGGDTYLKGWLKFHFSVFQPQDSICLCFKHTKKTKQWNYNKFFNIPKLGIFWHCFHCCWRDLGLLERNRLMPDIKGLFLLPASIQESHYISIEELFGPFRKFKTPYFVFSCKHCREIRGHWGEVHEAIFVVVSADLQTDQMWRLMWSSGFHFCLLSFSSQRSTFAG